MQNQINKFSETTNFGLLQMYPPKKSVSEPLKKKKKLKKKRKNQNGRKLNYTNVMYVINDLILQNNK
tara:strand:- start:435 stop:635 length:201 start_codon:yes stop_codon:yes gene_type:complete